MERLVLLGGSYTASSIIANCQRCVNLYPEANQKDSTVPLTFYQRPGLLPKTIAPGALPVRGLYQASNGAGYAVIGQGCYLVNPNWTLSHLGDLSSLTPNNVSFIDNGIDILLVDNSANGYTIHLATNVFAPFVDPSGLFQGATKVDYLDTFILWNMIGTSRFGSTLSNTLNIDPTYFASKSGYPDPISSLAVCRHELILIGTLKSEFWYDAGNAGFPFAGFPGATFEHGAISPWSVAQEDINIFWLVKNLQGQGIIVRVKGYEIKRISTHAIEQAIQQYPTLRDAIGFTCQFNGHVLYILTFPSGDATWVWDESTQLWHQWAWTDAQGILHRHRANCFAVINDTPVVGDWQNGVIYALDQNTYTDTLGRDTTPGPITFIRGFPHIQITRGLDGKPMAADGRQIQYHAFIADMECGNAPLNADGTVAQLTLRYSDDRGKTFSGSVLQSGGAPGEYLTQPKWPGLGRARDRIFELEWSFAGKSALNGAWVDAVVLEK